MANELLERGYFMRAIPAVHKLFAALPFQHSEHILDQIRSLSLVGHVALTHSHVDWFVEVTRMAVVHFDLIHKYGRFPHRNQALHRVCTPEETAYLHGEHHRFGQ